MLFPCYCRTRKGIQPKMENQKVQKKQCGKIPNVIFTYYLHQFYKALLDCHRSVMGWWVVGEMFTFLVAKFVDSVLDS